MISLGCGENRYCYVDRVGQREWRKYDDGCLQIRREQYASCEVKSWILLYCGTLLWCTFGVPRRWWFYGVPGRNPSDVKILLLRSIGCSMPSLFNMSLRNGSWVFNEVSWTCSSGVFKVMSVSVLLNSAHFCGLQMCPSVYSYRKQFYLWRIWLYEGSARLRLHNETCLPWFVNSLEYGDFEIIP